MRISTLQIFAVANNSIADANEAILKTQTQLSTGQRVLTPADDPVAATKMMQLGKELAALEQYGNNINIAENNLQAEETAIDGVLNLVQRMRELAVQAGNIGTLTPNDYQALSAEVDSRLDELYNMVNSRNAGGDYIFGGYKGGEQPFTGDANSGFSYEGDEGQMRIKISNNTTIAVSDSGKNLFVDIPSAENTFKVSANPANQSSPPLTISVGQVVDQAAYDNFYPNDMIVTFNSASDYTITERSTGNVVVANAPYTSGSEIAVNGVSVRVFGNPVAGDQMFLDSADNQDVLTTLARFSDAMKQYDGTSETADVLRTAVATTLDNLDNAQTRLLETTSELGARFNTIEGTKELHLDTELVSREILSDLRDLDYAEASTRLSAQTLILQAAHASFVRVSQLTLFSRL